MIRTKLLVSIWRWALYSDYNDDMNESQYSTTTYLLNGLRSGDSNAIDKLMRIYQPVLLRWAHGRIPEQAKSYMETMDLVQESMMLALKSNQKIKADNAGAFFCYLRSIFINQIKQELRKNKPFHLALTTRLSQSEVLSYEEDLNALHAYDQAISLLSEEEKQMVVMRIEFGLSHAEIAELTGRNSADAARVFIKRALDKLGGVMSCQN